MLEIRNLKFSYSKKHDLIRDFSFDLQSGSVCGLLGRNGAGKSTLLYLICGLLRPQSGTITLNGLVPFNREVPFLEDIFIVPEEFSLPDVTLDNYVKVNSVFFPKFDKNVMEHYLEIFDLDKNLHLGKLSMGQKKKVYLSFAMACNTSMLLLDEPTNGLDIPAKRNFRRAIAECMDDNKCIIISTHQVHDVDKILDHVVITDKGRILLDASICDIQDKYRFSFTSDRSRASSALLSLDVPGGMNIVEKKNLEEEETEVNLESLFELVMSKPEIFSGNL